MLRARAPLEKFQLLTSAFRKTMATLSDLKLNGLLEDGQSTMLCGHDRHHNYLSHSYTGCTDFQLAGVSCDDLLPLLILLLPQLPPIFLSQFWLHCLLLEDCCPSFLQAGWHGYILLGHLQVCSNSHCRAIGHSHCHSFIIQAVNLCARSFSLHELFNYTLTVD